MIIGIHQPYLFPYIGYWQLINAVDSFGIYDTATFSKHKYIRRNSIANSSICVELKHAESSTYIKDLQVDLCSVKNKKVLRTIKETYSHSEYFDVVYPIIVDILTLKTDNYCNLLVYQVKAICKYLGITTKLFLTSELEHEVMHGRSLRLINLIRLAGGNAYINAIGGQKLYNKLEFKEHGIDLSFLKTNETSRLSILDYLFNMSIEQVRSKLNNYSLI